MSVTPTTISFARGVPSSDMLPTAQIAEAAARALADDPAGVLAYGAAEGYAPLREWVADRYGAPVERVLLTNGSLQGLALLSELLFADAGGRAVVEAPTYDRTLLTLRRFGATVQSVPLEGDGVDVDALESRLEAGTVPGLVYLIPNFQNPAGTTMSRAKRERIVELAGEYEFLVLEDDPYRDLRFSGTDEPTMLSLDQDDRVIYSTSFTKTVAPGVRVGALILPPALFGRMRALATDTYIAPGHLSQGTVAAYCAADRFDAGVRRAAELLRERCDALCAAVDRHLGERAVYRRPDGGYFLWLRLPDTNTDDLATRAAEAGVPFVKGTSCYLDGGGTDELRLAFSACAPADMDPGVARLAALLD
jgi:DNA-binding transcriptional MocR family regulator